MQKTNTGRFAATIVATIAFTLAVGVSHAQRDRQPVPTNPALPTDQVPDDEQQKWQGRVVRVVNDDLIVKVEGEHETFDIAAEAKIRKDRKKVELNALVRGDFVTLHTVGGGKREVAVSVRAFSLR